MKKIRALLSIFLFLSVILSACSIATPQPTSTATTKPSETPLPTLTFTSPPTNTLTVTQTPELVIECSVPNGKWESNEKTDLFYKLSPLLIFQVDSCKIVSIEISALPAPEELFWYPFDSLDILITNGNFTTALNNPIGGVGDLTIQGKFDTETSSHGTIQFPKGFSVVDYILNEDVSIEWTASPIK